MLEVAMYPQSTKIPHLGHNLGNFGYFVQSFTVSEENQVILLANVFKTSFQQYFDLFGLFSYFYSESVVGGFKSHPARLQRTPDTVK